MLRNVALAGLLVAIGAAGALGLHAQTERPTPTPPDNPVPTDLPDRSARDEIAAATSCEGLELRAALYAQIPDLDEPYATYARLADERITELGC